MRRLPYLWLDVFGDRPFTGNALCVILDGTALTDVQMQAIARETNLSETTFVLPPTSAEATYRNRIFTPGGELAFAGHPTLGTAAALALSGRIDGVRAVQETRHGLTPIELVYDGGELVRVVMDAPTPTLVAEPEPVAVARVLGLTVEQVTPGGMRPAVISAGVQHLIVPVDSVATLAAVEPDTQAILRLSRELGVIGVYPLALMDGNTGQYARARLFAPLFGIVEDAATGSAAAPVGYFLQRYDRLPSEHRAFWYEQGVEMGRPSRLWVAVSGSVAEPVVRVGGAVQLLGHGEFELP